VEKPIEKPKSSRISSLDGLRGVASFVVVLHHSLLIIPALSSSYYGGRGTPGTFWLNYTPVHVIWAGGEAVFVFFILSGVVLTLLVVKRPTFNWLSYYPSRLIRLYLPVLASVAIALLLVFAFSRSGVSGSDWLEAHDERITLHTVIKDCLLFMGTSFLNSPLWSLRWEVLFSVLLPLYVWVAKLVGRGWWVAIVAALVLAKLGAEYGEPMLAYMPMFFIGSVIAIRLDELALLAKRVLGGSPVTGWAIFVSSILGITCVWWIAAFDDGPVNSLTRPVVVLSGAILVVLAIYWEPAVRMLNLPVVRWLGRISFSLYLTHEPIVVSLGILMPGTPWLVPVIGIPIALVVAWLFFIVIEKPTHRLAQLLGTRRIPTR
jgi:peptidoglycan/LPS O-acetylase OafA/YrhL